MAMGLIAAALGGFGKALSSVGEMEAKKQNEAKLRKELMAAESDERLRIDEITRKRNLEGIGDTAKANLAAAPIVGQTTVATESAALDAAKTAKLDEKRAQAKVGGQVAELDAAENAKLAEKLAKNKVGGQIAELDARRDLKADEREANAAMEKRLAELKAEKKLDITKLEAERNARVEKEKYEAMISAGVPKAKADALMAEYTAGDPLRKKQANDAIDAEIAATVKKGGSKDYLKAESKISVAKSAGNIAEINAREANYRKREKDEGGGKTTITELKTKLTVAEDRLATELGVPRAKINEATLTLQKKADRGEAPAIKKLKEIESYRKDVERAQETISRWKDPDSSSSSGSSNSGKKPLGEFKN